MEEYRATFWKHRLEAVRKELEKNGFEVHLADRADRAQSLVLETILPATGAKSIAWGGSMTVLATGLYQPFKEKNQEFEVYDTYDRSVSPEEMIELRRRALLVDCFITGTNAVTETGMLVNLDKIGNRVAALTFGPRWVVVVAGRNKIVADVSEALDRVKDYAAPMNAMRLGAGTPCTKTAVCEDCAGANRICNSWTITEKSFPAGRIKIVLINEDLGM